MTSVFTETFSLTVHERLHLGDWHGGAGCRFGRIGLWVRVSGEAAQGADVQRVGGLDHGEVLLRHRHHLDLRGVRFLWSFCLKFLERTTERRSISSCSRTAVWTESDQKSSELSPEDHWHSLAPGSVGLSWIFASFNETTNVSLFRTPAPFLRSHLRTFKELLKNNVIFVPHSCGGLNIYSTDVHSLPSAAPHWTSDHFHFFLISLKRILK